MNKPSMQTEFQFVIDGFSQPAWICLPDGLCSHLSAHWMRHTGLKESELLGLGWIANSVHPDDQDRTLNHWMGAVCGLLPFEIEFRLRRYDGKYIWFKALGTAVQDEDQQLQHWFGSCFDIESNKKTESELRESLRIRDEFLSIISHELKNPLTILKLQAQLQKHSIEKNQSVVFTANCMNKLVDQVEKQVIRLNRLVDDMLDISRIRSGKLKLKAEKFDFCELVDEVIAEMSQQFQKYEYSLPIFKKCEKAEGFWDRARMQQVLSNLLTNAIRYGNHQQITVVVEVDEDNLFLSVQDKGIGIAKEAQDKIFNSFERAEKSAETTGLGLGLFITRQIVQTHNGKITVKSEPGAGSVFQIVLPRWSATPFSGQQTQSLPH